MCPFEARGGAATGPTSKLRLAAGRHDRAPVFCRKPENQRWGLGGQQQAAQTARAAGGRPRYSSLFLAARRYHPAARRAHGHPQATPKHHGSPSIAGRCPAPSCSAGMPQSLLHGGCSSSPRPQSFPFGFLSKMGLVPRPGRRTKHQVKGTSSSAPTPCPLPDRWCSAGQGQLPTRRLQSSELDGAGEGAGRQGESCWSAYWCLDLPRQAAQHARGWQRR